MSEQHKLLIVGDSPTVFTGFGEVVRSLAQRWLPHFSEIHNWAINYNGWPHEYPYKLYTAGYSDWATMGNLEKLLNLILASDFTHLFILCDSHNLATGNFPQVLRQVCDKKNVHITHYFPVDAPLEKEWLELVKLADVAATYTDYARRETHKLCPTIPLHVLPHGVDTSIYYPREDRESLREQMLGKWVKPDEFLLLNVNRNERRKAPQHSLQIIKLINEIGVKAKLLMHCPNFSPGTDMYNLEMMARQLDVPRSIWEHNDANFVKGNGKMTRDGMNQLYNCADMVLSTSTGEGWGLSISEGVAAGCAVACPDSTATAEIADTLSGMGHADHFIKLPLSENCIANAWDSSRIRYPVDVRKSADLIAQKILETQPGRCVLGDTAKEWMSWDRVANEFLKLMGVK